jgi:hypothetical protein
MHLIVPDGYRGVIKLQFERRDGIRLPREDGVYMIHLPPDGELQIRHPKLTRRWHRMTAQYEDGTPIPYVMPPPVEPVPDDVVAIRALRNLPADVAPQSDAWYYVGTEDEARELAEEIYWPAN